MNKFLEKLKRITSSSNKDVLVFGTWVSLIIAFLLYFFDKNLAIGLVFSSILTFLLFFIIFKFSGSSKKIYLLFTIVFVVHLLAVVFIYYTDFRPSGGGADFESYDITATEISQRLKQGIFSLDGLYNKHYFPVLIGVIYALTVPEIIVGQIFSAWLAALSVLLSYFLIIEIGGSRKSAFIAGILICFYPSYLYFGSLLLKDIIVIPLVLLGLLLAVQILKSFNLLKLFFLFSIITATIHIRFYIGFALMLSFIICWFLLSNLKWPKRIIYGLAIFFISGFLPQIAGFSTYYGVDLFNHYLDKDTVQKYREVVYVSPPPVKNETPETKNNNEEVRSGEGSSFVVPSGVEDPLKFTKNYFVSFAYSLLGPFPWQLKFIRHAYFLADTIPFYIIIVVFLYGVLRAIKASGFLVFAKNHRFTLPLILFSLMAFGALSILINNFGIIARIRMPMYIVILCVMSIVFELSYSLEIKKVARWFRSKFI